MGSTLTPHQFIARIEYYGGPFYAIIKQGITETSLDESLAPDLYAAVQAFREGVTPLYQALEALIVHYGLQCSPEEFWDGCE
jgi:hypothetical protein